jgi:hypothetical protein
MIVLVTRDLFFASKVTGTARQLGLPAASVSTLDAVRERMAAGGVTAVILDLGSGLPPGELAAAVVTSETGTRPKLAAFGAHVETAALDAARTAGFDDVLPRSRFSATLPALLQSLSAPG